jgi:hypothetical protein
VTRVVPTGLVQRMKLGNRPRLLIFLGSVALFLAGCGTLGGISKVPVQLSGVEAIRLKNKPVIERVTMDPDAGINQAVCPTFVSIIIPTFFACLNLSIDIALCLRILSLSPFIFLISAL